MSARPLRAVDTPLDPDRADVVVLRAPGKQASTEHPMLGPLPVRMTWQAHVHRMMLDGVSLYEADQIACELMHASHDGKGRRFQPSGLR